MELFSGLIQETIKIANNSQIDKNSGIIKLYENFNQEIINFPKYLRHLHLKFFFDQKINEFPKYLLYLH
jgi:hypothetical protein